MAEVRARPRLAIAMVAVLAVLIVGAVTAGELIGGGYDHHQLEFQHR